MTDLDDILSSVSRRQLTTIPDLRRAASILEACPLPRDVDILVARVRVAFLLEKLGA